MATMKKFLLFYTWLIITFSVCYKKSRLRGTKVPCYASVFDNDCDPSDHDVYDPDYEFPDSQECNSYNSSDFSDSEFGSIEINSNDSPDHSSNQVQLTCGLNPENGPIEQNLTIASNSPKFQFNDYVNKKRNKKRTFCKFCQQRITNFERHLVRHHGDRKEVRDMMSCPKTSRERYQILKIIRNSGNFEIYLQGEIVPVYRKQQCRPSNDYQPCAYCKGLFKKSFLFRHAKKCPAKQIHSDLGRVNHLSASQTLVAVALDSANTLNKLRVKMEVFNKMKADNISMVAKTDSLIFLYGDSYSKSHSRAQMTTPCSNKMRELARLLITLRNIENKDDLKLVDVIDPEMFEKVVESARILSGYDQEIKKFKSASLGAHYGTLLKAVSELLLYLIQCNSQWMHFENKEEEYVAVQRFRDLVTTRWTREISSLALKSLNENRWKKPTILPLTKDIITLKNHITSVGNLAVTNLTKNFYNRSEYENLVNASLALTIMYNRRKIGDVQYTQLDTYLKNYSSSNQKEFLESLTPSEKVLTKRYKRVVTGGKGSRPIVILFPPNLQDYMNLIIKIRTSTDLVPQENKFLFAHPGTTNWIRADKVIRNFAVQSKVEKPEYISSNSLRKQIATVMQILNLNKEDEERFSNFMGHTNKTHNEFYKLSEDVYDTAKISKLLIIMDKGIGQNYKGMTLNEIKINPEEEVAKVDDDKEDEGLGEVLSQQKMYQ